MDEGTLYDTDIVAWADQQSSAIREVASTRPDLSNLLDWEHLAEEMESLSRTELKSVTNPLRLVLVHMLKAYADPDSPALGHWRHEVRNWLSDVREEFTPAMRRKIDLDEIWRRGVERAANDLASFDVTVPLGLPPSCPFGLDEILAADWNLDAGVERLRRR